MPDHHEDDLAASRTEGFKVGEKKSLAEYAELGMDLFYFILFYLPTHAFLAAWNPGVE